MGQLKMGLGARRLRSPAGFNVLAGLALVVFRADPVQVRRVIDSAGAQRVHVIDLPAWAGAARLARGGAGVGLAELALHSRGAGQRLGHWQP